MSFIELTHRENAEIQSSVAGNEITASMAPLPKTLKPHAVRAEEHTAGWERWVQDPPHPLLPEGKVSRPRAHC